MVPGHFFSQQTKKKTLLGSFQGGLVRPGVFGRSWSTMKRRDRNLAIHEGDFYMPIMRIPFLGWMTLNYFFFIDQGTCDLLVGAVIEPSNIRISWNL